MGRITLLPTHVRQKTIPPPSLGKSTGWARIAFIAALLLVYLLGSYAALKSPIVQDTEQEQNNLRVNLMAVSGLIHDDISAYMSLQDYKDKYYGIGFDVPAYPIQTLLYRPVAQTLHVDHETAFLLVKHWLSFNLFFASGILVLLLFHRILSDAAVARSASLAYLLWPFLLGHSVCNVKDIPFLFAWLLCTWIGFKLMLDACAGKPPARKFLLALGICTGWLISIRIAGILIFFQYALMAACTWRICRLRGKLISLPAGDLALCLGACVAFVMLAYPVFWVDLREFFVAIQYMGHHPMANMGVCSLVYGTCLPIAGASPLYLPAWLSVKLPLTIIAGILLLPFMLRKMAKSGAAEGWKAGHHALAFAFILATFLTALLIPALLIVRRAILYHDLRHVLFLLPLFYLCGVVGLYWLSRRLAVILLTLAIVTFSADNILSFPYQYIWFNEATRFSKIDENFDTDYWGSAAENAYARLLRYARSQPPVQCLYGDHEVLFRHVRPDTFSCVKLVGELTTNAPRPFLIIALSNQIRPPHGCIQVDSEKSRLLLATEPLHLRKIWHCR